jgi:hypothetical protein
MTDWRKAEELLKAICADLQHEQPDWSSPLRSTKNVQLLIPDFPLFQEMAPGEVLPRADVRLALLRTDLDQLELGLTKTDRILALGSAASALRNVQELGRKAKAQAES